MRWHVFVDVLEHRRCIQERTLGQRAELDRFFPTRGDMRLQLLFQGAVTLLGPLTERNEMLLQSIDRVPQRPRLVLILRTVPRRVITGRVSSRAIGDVLDQRWTATHTRTFSSPLCCCV